MMRSFRTILYCLFLSLFFFTLPFVSAIENGQHITLLSVSETDEGEYVGGTATLYLELRPGSGSVFIDSYPLTKIDTQVATRVANEIACDFSTVDCSQFDFFYTIRANAPIIGGPSAGGATALLTLATLEDVRLPEDLAMTGAISSGGVITPVAGIQQKLTAAQETDHKVALIPALAITTQPEFLANSTIADSITQEEIDAFSLTIHEVTDVREALATVSRYERAIAEQIIIPDFYSEEMARTAQRLCSRAESLLANITDVTPGGYNASLERYTQASILYDNEQYYASASYCYTANLRAQELLMQDLTQEEKADRYDALLTSIIEDEQTLDEQDLRTFGDLETYGIVKERLLEARRYLEDINTSNISSAALAYATERAYSAQAWSGFFTVTQDGPRLELNQQNLRDACVQELQFVQTRTNYLESFLPEFFLADITRDYNDAYRYLNDRIYPLCLFKATQAKAQADLYISSTSLNNESVLGLIDAKQERTQELIAGQDVFPILGYSYYEYAGALAHNDSESALLFAEYALAFSDLSAYFPREKETAALTSTVRLDLVLMFIGGLASGVLLTLLLTRKKSTSAGSRRTKK